MKRWNPQTHAWERKQGEEWVRLDEGAASEDTGLDAALGAAFTESALQPTAAVPVPTAPATQAAEVGLAALAADLDRGGAAGGVGLDSGDVAGVADDANGVVGDIPGLTSADGQRGVRGTQSVRQRLSALAQRGRRGSGGTPGRKIAVGPRAARPSGPAVREGTAVRQSRKRSVPVPEPETKGQRYVNRPAPELLSSRPKWQQELFEAHFRSDMTLQLRRQHNRMKISRTDYAIGWLTLLDKIREEPSIARLKDAGNGTA